jgi:predicted transcriptional regulator
MQPNITTEEIASKLSITRRTVAHYIKEMKKEGKLIRQNGRKNGYWKINNNG